MSLEDYLNENIKSEILQEISEFKKSSKYEDIKEYTSSNKYKTTRKSLINRDKDVHKSTLADIERLQNKILVS